MTCSRKTILGLFVLLVISLGFAPPRPSTPAPIKRIVAARPFTLATGYRFQWRADRPLVNAGYLVVLDVDPALVYPRQTAEPVLYVDRTTAQRFNVGYGSGRVVAIVPSTLDETGALTLDLNRAPIWFGAPALPERVTRAETEASRETATLNGVEPRPAPEIAHALRQVGGETVLELANERALYDAAAQLVERYASDEQELARQWRLPAKGR